MIAGVGEFFDALICVCASGSFFLFRPEFAFSRGGNRESGRVGIGVRVVGLGWKSKKVSARRYQLWCVVCGVECVLLLLLGLAPSSQHMRVCLCMYRFCVFVCVWWCGV